MGEIMDEPKKLFHGTARALGCMIEKQGLKPEGCTIVPERFRKSCYSKRGYIYFFDNPELAKTFGCGVAERVGISNECQVFVVDSKDVKLEPDPLMLGSAWMHKGGISPDKIKTHAIYEC